MIRPGKMMPELLRSIGRKAATVLYPAVKVQMPPSFRGKLKFDAAKCIGCKLCMRDCPSGAITIRKIGEKKFEAEIDISRCIFCAQCVDSCVKKALEATPEFELAQLKRDKMKCVYHAEPGTEPPPQPAAAAQPESAAIKAP